MKRNIYFSMAIVLALLLGCNRNERSPQSPQTRASSLPSPTPSSAAAETKWKTVAEFDYTWTQSQPALHFKFELPEGYQDAGDFTRIRIQAPGKPEFVLDNQDGWIAHDKKEQPSPVYDQLRKRNLVLSRYALLLSDSGQKDAPPLLFLRSWGYASNAERLHVIGFQPTGQPIALFNDELELLELTDLDGDGYREIVGRPCLSQEFGDGLETYAPFRVYKIPHPVVAPATLSLPSSETYNLKHYYGWAGPDCSNKVVVVEHPPAGGKPIVMKLEEAEKLMHEAKEEK